MSDEKQKGQIQLEENDSLKIQVKTMEVATTQKDIQILRAQYDMANQAFQKAREGQMEMLEEVGKKVGVDLRQYRIDHNTHTAFMAQPQGMPGSGPMSPQMNNQLQEQLAKLKEKKDAGEAKDNAGKGDEAKAAESEAKS